MRISTSHLVNEDLGMDTEDFILDDGFLADNTCEFYETTSTDMYSKIIHALKTEECTVKSMMTNSGLAISIDMKETK